MPKISEILSFLTAESIPFTFSGNEKEIVEGFSSLTQYKLRTFTWVKKQENIPEGFDLSQVALAFASEEVVGTFRNVIRTAQSKRAFFSAIEHFYGENDDRPAIGQFTYISPRVKLGKNVRIGHNCTLDGDITIGDNTAIWNNVVIMNRVKIGVNCEIQSGAVIGQDGFAYTENDNHEKTMVKHYGGVEIGNNVHIGSNIVIDRSQIDDTVVGDGCKLDPLSHIAHNVCLEENCTVISCTNLMGSVHVKKNAYISSSIIRNQATIGENATVGMGAVVTKDVADGAVVVGNPGKPFEKR